MGSFDPATFLDINLEGGFDTKLVPVPEGEYSGITGAPSLREATGKDGTKYTFLEVPIEVDSTAMTADNRTVKDVTGRDKNSVRFSTSIEFTPAGAIDRSKGKNVGFGRLLEAVGLNQPGKGFSMRAIEGRPVKVQVKHRVVDGDIFADVKGIGPL